MAPINLSKLDAAIKTLEKDYTHHPSELERDGLIQRFEFTMELSWKLSKKILAENGIDTDIPKNVFRELAKIGWIDNPEEWIEFINKRNRASHIYNQEMAQDVFSGIENFIKQSRKLYLILKQKSND
ncbi:MAG: HI0074 family nucleotidyltransferase substrate-binding subunit [Bacteriovoracaceae bacterium]